MTNNYFCQLTANSYFLLADNCRLIFVGVNCQLIFVDSKGVLERERHLQAIFPSSNACKSMIPKSMRSC